MSSGLMKFIPALNLKNCGLRGPFLFLGRIRGTLKKGTLLNPLLALLNRELTERVYSPKGPPNPIPYLQSRKQAKPSMQPSLMRRPAFRASSKPPGAGEGGIFFALLGGLLVF